MDPKFFGPNIFLDLKTILEPKTFFGPKNCFEPKNFFEPKIILEPKKLLDPKTFLYPKINFVHKIFIWTQFFRPKFFRPKFFFVSKISKTQIFLTQKDLVWFYAINLPNQNLLNKRLSKLNTLDLSLVILVMTGVKQSQLLV